MGDFTIRIHAVGNHGCQRDVKSGGTLAHECGYDGCPDCMTRRFIDDLRAKGTSVKIAVLRHWPADVEGYAGQDEVTDNLLTGQRKGSF